MFAIDAGKRRIPGIVGSGAHHATLDHDRQQQHLRGLLVGVGDVEAVEDVAHRIGFETEIERGDVARIGVALAPDRQPLDHFLHHVVGQDGQLGVSAPVGHALEQPAQRDLLSLRQRLLLCGDRIVGIGGHRNLGHRIHRRWCRPGGVGECKCRGQQRGGNRLVHHSKPSAAAGPEAPAASLVIPFQSAVRLACFKPRQKAKPLRAHPFAFQQ